MNDAQCAQDGVALPLVVIDGMGDVWVRDHQDGVDLYWEGGTPLSPREDPLTYAEIERRWGISTWLTSQKSAPS
jgi:hypothetical protein